jgi:hypothetical protein
VDLHRGNQAAPFFQCFSEAGLGGYRFHSGIDHFVPDIGILGPEGDKAPVIFVQDVRLIQSCDSKDLLGWCHVVVGHSLTVRLIDGEILLELFYFSESNKAAAHCITLVSALYQDIMS